MILPRSWTKSPPVSWWAPCFPVCHSAARRPSVRPRRSGKPFPRMADEHLEEARNVVRRLMWRMNEESGNIGLGHSRSLCPECLAQHRRLSAGASLSPSSIPTSLIRARATISVDNNVLRRSCFRAVERFRSGPARYPASKARGPLQAGFAGGRRSRLPRKSPEKHWARIGMF